MFGVQKKVSMPFNSFFLHCYLEIEMADHDQQRVSPERREQMKDRLIGGYNCDLCQKPAVMACYMRECGQLYCLVHKEVSEC